MFIKALKKVLIVDDDPDIVDSLSLVLQEEGYKVATATTPSELVKYSTGDEEKDLPDIILLDIFLAGTDGRQLARQLKHLPKTRSIPIIMISAHPYALHTVKDYGADDMLPKPFNIDLLLSKVEKNIKKTLH